MSQRWGVGLAVLLLVAVAAVVVTVLARGPRGAHARRPRRPRTLMVSGLVVLPGAAFAGAWAATLTSGPFSGRPGNGSTAGNGTGSGGGSGAGAARSGEGAAASGEGGAASGEGGAASGEGAAPDGDGAPSPFGEPNLGSPPAPASPDQLAQIAGGRAGVPVRDAIAAATGAGGPGVAAGGAFAVAAGPTERTDDGPAASQAADDRGIADWRTSGRWNGRGDDRRDQAARTDDRPDTPRPAAPTEPSS